MANQLAACVASSNMKLLLVCPWLTRAPSLAPGAGQANSGAAGSRGSRGMDGADGVVPNGGYGLVVERARVTVHSNHPMTSALQLARAFREDGRLVCHVQPGESVPVKGLDGKLLGSLPPDMAVSLPRPALLSGCLHHPPGVHTSLASVQVFLMLISDSGFAVIRFVPASSIGNAQPTVGVVSLQHLVLRTQQPQKLDALLDLQQELLTGQKQLRDLLANSTAVAVSPHHRLVNGVNVYVRGRPNRNPKYRVNLLSRQCAASSALVRRPAYCRGAVVRVEGGTTPACSAHLPAQCLAAT